MPPASVVEVVVATRVPLMAEDLEAEMKMAAARRQTHHGSPRPRATPQNRLFPNPAGAAPEPPPGCPNANLPQNEEGSNMDV